MYKRQTLHWYRPLFPALDQPLARDLLDYQTVHEDAARRVDEEPLGPWSVTEHQLMKDFYLGGNHEKTLNENMDSSLFDETFVVFEIDSIKDCLLYTSHAPKSVFQVIRAFLKLGVRRHAHHHVEVRVHEQ